MNICSIYINILYICIKYIFEGLFIAPGQQARALSAAADMNIRLINMNCTMFN